MKLSQIPERKLQAFMPFKPLFKITEIHIIIIILFIEKERADTVIYRYCLYRLFILLRKVLCMI